MYVCIDESSFIGLFRPNREVEAGSNFCNVVYINRDGFLPDDLRQRLKHVRRIVKTNLRDKLNNVQQAFVRNKVNDLKKH